MQVVHEAAFTGRVEVVRVLMELGADKSITNDDGETPAEVAESRGHETIAALLRE
jgi:ankyrin repeat protein